MHQSGQNIVNFQTKIEPNIFHSKRTKYYYPQRAQRAGGIVRVWQIFGHGYDFPTWSELGTKSKVKVTYFNGKKYLKEFKKYL